MNKPSWFQPLDLIPLLFPVLAAVYAFAHGFEAAHPTQAGALLIAVPVVMWTLWGIVVWQRKKWLDRCYWFPTYRCLVDTEKSDGNDGYLPPAAHEWDTFIATVAQAWTPFHPAADRLLRIRTKVIYFRKGLDEKPISPKIGLVNGLTVAGGSTLYVDYDSKLDVLEKTALAHELGHVIHGLATGGWDQSEHHEFAKKNHLR